MRTVGVDTHVWIFKVWGLIPAGQKSLMKVTPVNGIHADGLK